MLLIWNSFFLCFSVFSVSQILHCSMKTCLTILCLVITSISYSQVDTTQKIISGRKNSVVQQQKPYVILISSDGFRYDYARKYNAQNLLELSKNGVRAKSMQPSFPSLTFPNHYTVVTGLYPSHSGLVGNGFYDRSTSERYSMYDSNSVTNGSKYGGIPLWVLAEEQQMLSASFYWVGSEAPIRNTRPTYYYRYNEKISIEKRIQIVIDWLRLPEDVRPHMITFYMPETDHVGHDYGPDAPQTKEAVLFVDKAIKDLTDAVQATGLPVNFIFLADHGMSNVNTAKPVILSAEIDSTKYVKIPGSQLYQIYAIDKKNVDPLYRVLKNGQNGYKVYLKKDMPRRFKYRHKDDVYNRIGDIVILPDWPNVIKFSDRKIKPGAHGYDPYKIKEMHSVFYAWGPAFRKGVEVNTFNAIHVYPLITEILGLNVTQKIDGRKILARKMLK